MVETGDSEPNRASAEDRPETPGDRSGGRSFPSYLQSVAQISGVVTIIAATIYALGVFTLVLPISNSYDSTFPAAWYAASVVPKTVVAGHGIKSLVWPSLALTLTTTLFALMVLWVLYILSVGWHHAQATMKQPALNVTSLAIIYSLLGALVAVINTVVFPAILGWLGAGTLGAGISPHVLSNVALAAVPASALIVLSCSIAAVLGVVRAVRYMRRPTGGRGFPSVSFRGFISKGMIFAGLSIAFLLSLILLSELARTEASAGVVDSIQRPIIALYVGFSILFLLLFLVAMLFLILKGLRYIAELVMESRSKEAFPSLSAPFRSLGRWVAQRVSAFAPTLLYSVALFTVFYLALFIALNNLRFFVIPLIGNASEGIKSRSWLDECFIPLVVLGAFISLAIMYRKDWRGLGRGEYYSFSEGSWLSFSKDLLKDIGSRSVRSGLFLSLVVAYAIALASAFLLAQLSAPPLPKVEVSELVAQPESGQPPGQVPDFQGKTLALLAHTEGYWYLIDEEGGELLVVPDRDDKVISLRLDEQAE